MRVPAGHEVRVDRPESCFRVANSTHTIVFGRLPDAPGTEKEHTPMNRFRNFLPLVAVLAGAVVLGAPNTAKAAFSVRVTTTAGSATIADGGAGDLDGLLNGSITVNYGDSAYHLVGTISFTNAPGSPNQAILDVSYNVNTFGTTGGAASLEASATGFTLPNSNPETANLLLNGNGSGSGTLSAQGWVLQNGALFAQGGTVLGPLGPFNTNGGYSGSASASYNGATPYALTEKLSFNLAANANTSGDGQLTVTVPAPAGLVLACAGLPFCAFAVWVRRRKLVTAA